MCDTLGYVNAALASMPTKNPSRSVAAPRSIQKLLVHQLSPYLTLCGLGSDLLVLFSAFNIQLSLHNNY